MRGGEDRSTRKSFDTFTPMGPVLVTADEFGDPGDAELRCWVSGDLRQQARTGDLIWGVARLVSYASSVTTLYPGDVITTGTPAGVGPLTAGDDIRLEISGLGLDLTARVAADDAVASPTAGQSRPRRNPVRGRTGPIVRLASPYRLARSTPARTMPSVSVHGRRDLGGHGRNER